MIFKCLPNKLAKDNGRDWNLPVEQQVAKGEGALFEY